ncbi:HEPN domain-containing protein [Pedobacter gandavensis]|uniref:HEPN domain-containing protein n=1 Tax=Pedobacter TaxID=84567 RepID=UPI001C9A021B|nr:MULTISPECIES: HEPN domain-containing protein [Pedobacter]WGQ09032.1 HEPN domain-containing protein [Pedobacter gandavensis]|eukprot:gene9442-11052_t
MDENYKTIKENGDLIAITSKLINIAMIEQIYVKINDTIAGDRNLITVVVSNMYTKHISEIMPLVDAIMLDYPEYNYLVNHLLHVKEAIKRGNLFFYDACGPKRQFYNRPACNNILFYDDLDVEKMIMDAKKSFKHEIKKVNEFKETAAACIENGYTALAAFMLHQQIELSYRAIEIATMGKDKVTHSIRLHQKYVSIFHQELSNVFDVNNETESRLLDQLDSAYLEVRYEPGFAINKEKLMKIKHKADLITEATLQIFERTLLSVEKEIILSGQIPILEIRQTTESEGLPPEIDATELNDESIIDKIKNIPGVQFIICFGEKICTIDRNELLIVAEQTCRIRKRYDLLIITENDLQQELYNLQGMNNSERNTDKFSFVVLTKKQVQKGLEMHQRFLLGALKNGLLLFSNGDDLTELLGEIQYIEEYSQNELDCFLVDWYNRYNNAESFIESANDLSNGESLPAQLSMFNQGLEQLCLGLLQVFIDYKPNRNSLGHLMDLCCSFLSFPEEIFPRTNIEDLELFTTLTDSFSKVRYKGNIDASSNELGIILKRCNLFLEKADEAARTKIKEMKEKKYAD